MGMLTATEYKLKAENYAAAAQTVDNDDLRLELMRISAAYRNKALRIQLGKQANVLRRCPYPRDQLRPY
jgi:hypothetical protein